MLCSCGFFPSLGFEKSKMPDGKVTTAGTGQSPNESFFFFRRAIARGLRKRRKRILGLWYLKVLTNL
jgi:hypothetical protein